MTPRKQNTTLSAKDLKIDPEVYKYLLDKGLELPKFPPKIITPSPGNAPGSRFDPSLVDKVLTTFSFLRHTQGKWSGQPLIPDPWQIAYIIAPIFGWVHQNEDGDWVRVVREVYVDVPRKNGKTTLSGGVALYLLGADGEAGAQVYACATRKDQAKLLFDPIKTLVNKSPDLRGHMTTLAGKITHPKSGSYFSVVASEGDALHGTNVHGAIIDELHLHKNPDLVEAIETGVGSRTQPVIFTITTADTSNSGSIYDRKRRYVEQLATGVFSAPMSYGVVFACDDNDDPFSEETWYKANPGLGISPGLEFMRTAANKARNSPAELASFQRLHLGIRTKQLTKYIMMNDWDANQVENHKPLSEQIGMEAYGGLDLASTSDLCSLCWLVPDGKGGLDAYWRIWTPEHNMDALNKRTAGEAEVWRRNGLITVTPGNVADYDWIFEQIKQDMDILTVREIGYDPWNSTQLATDLESFGAPMTPVRQGFASMSSPTKEFQRMVLDYTGERPKFRHDGNPCVRWQVDNFAVMPDSAGNVKPAKDMAADKIDAVVASIIAMDAYVRQLGVGRSVYEDRDMIIL